MCQARLPGLSLVTVTAVCLAGYCPHQRAKRHSGGRRCAAAPGCCSRQWEWQRLAQVLGGTAARGNTPRAHSKLQLGRRVLASGARRRAQHAAAQRPLHGAGRPTPCFACHCLNHALQPLQCLIQPRPAASALRGYVANHCPGPASEVSNSARACRSAPQGRHLGDRRHHAALQCSRHGRQRRRIVGRAGFVRRYRRVNRRRRWAARLQASRQVAADGCWD